MESNSFDHIQAYYDSDNAEESYVEDLRPRLNMQPVFEKARLLQIDLAQKHFSLDQITTAYHDLSSLTSELESDAGEQGLISQIVEMSGEGIVVPKVDISLADDSLLLTPLSSEDQQIKLYVEYLNPQVVDGLFCGFSIRFNKLCDDAGNVITVSPRLVYQVQRNYIETPFIQGPVFATGEVGLTQLEFEEDRKADKILENLTYLYQIDDSAVRESVNLLNLTLHSQRKNDAELIRHIALHAEMIINNPKVRAIPAVQDNIIALVKQRIDEDTRYTIAVNGYYGYVEAEDVDGVSVIAYHEDPSLPLTLQRPLEHIVFMPKHKQIANRLRPTGKESLCFAVVSKESVIFLPFAEVMEFSE